VLVDNGMQSPPSLLDRESLRTPAKFVPWIIGVTTTTAILSLTSGLWFFSEDLYFALDRPLDPNSVFYPNSEHLVAGPVLLYRFLYRFVGLSHFWIWMIPAAVSHSLLLVILAKGTTDRWKLRLVYVAIVFGLFGPGYLNFIWPFQYAFIAGICCGLLSLRRVTQRWSQRLPNSLQSWTADAALLLLGVVHGSTAVIVIPAYLVVGIASRNRAFFWRSVLTLTMVVVPYAIWYLHYAEAISGLGRRLSAAEFALTTAPSVVESVARAGLALTGVPWTSPVGPTLGLTVAGLLFALTLWRHRATSLAMALLITLVVSTITVNFTRRTLLGRTPDTEHYVYLWSALLVGLACCVLPEAFEALKPRLSFVRVSLVLTLFCLFAGGANAVSLRRTVLGRERYLTEAMCAYGVGRTDPTGTLLAEKLSYPPIATGRFTELLQSGKMQDHRLSGARQGCNDEQR
jgi:hypothetical protein